LCYGCVLQKFLNVLGRDVAGEQLRSASMAEFIESGAGGQERRALAAP
jgi:hypothetical protein